MSSFTLPLIVKHLDGHRWELAEGFEYYTNNDVIKVPKGFITDFASIPRLFWSTVGHPTGKWGKAAVIHDYLYANQTTSRRKADRIMLEAMRVLKVPFWKRWLAYRVVRLVGWVPWKKYKKR